MSTDDEVPRKRARVAPQAIVDEPEPPVPQAPRAQQHETSTVVIDTETLREDPEGTAEPKAPDVRRSPEGVVIQQSTEAPPAPEALEAPVAPADLEAPVAPPDLQAPVAPPDLQAPVAPADLQAPVAPPEESDIDLSDGLASGTSATTLKDTSTL